jgi:hypothetical protein
MADSGPDTVHVGGLGATAAPTVAVPTVAAPTVAVEGLPLIPGRNPFDIHVYFSGSDEIRIATAFREEILSTFDWLRKQR